MPEINYLWTPPAPVSLPVRGTRARFPVNRLFFVGRNYQAHAREMGTSVDKASMRPVYFTKFSAMLAESGTVANARSHANTDEHLARPRGRNGGTTVVGQRPGADHGRISHPAGAFSGEAAGRRSRREVSAAVPRDRAYGSHPHFGGQRQRSALVALLQAFQLLCPTLSDKMAVGHLRQAIRPRIGIGFRP